MIAIGGLIGTILGTVIGLWLWPIDQFGAWYMSLELAGWVIGTFVGICAYMTRDYFEFKHWKKYHNYWQFLKWYWKD